MFGKRLLLRDALADVECNDLLSPLLTGSIVLDHFCYFELSLAEEEGKAYHDRVFI